VEGSGQLHAPASYPLGKHHN